jgi:LemA protein
MLINIILIIVVIISGAILINYNKFVKKNNKVKERESYIDVLLNQRFDLIPNIVECVKGYASHESSTLEELTNLRSNYNKNTFSIKDNEIIDKKFNNVMLLAEAYPDLKANGQFLSLQRNLNEIENNLSNARASYNRAVNVYNNLVESVPSNIIAKIFGFERKEFFKLKEDKKANVSVNLEN